MPHNVASTAVSIDWEMALVILHPLYPGTEPIPPGRVISIYSIFGLRFGVPYLDVDGDMYGRPFSGSELMLCYSIPEHIIPDRSK